VVDRKDDNPRFLDNEEDAVGKAMKQSSADILLNFGKRKRTIYDRFKRGFDLKHSPIPKPRSLVFVPSIRLVEIKLGARTKDELVGHYRART
jgi:hypothetical protein